MELKDFYKWQFCNEWDKLAFAIEPEIASTFLDKLDYNDYKRESYKIYELLRVHIQNETTRLNIHDKIKEEYKDKFPVWSDWKLSWWTHFVLFGDFWEFKDKNIELKNKILNCPLHLKTMDLKFYSRELSHRSTFDNRASINVDNKWYFVALKTELHSNWEYNIDWCPIEFRCNNVFDDRILWYYQWILLAVRRDVKFKILSDEFRKYAKNWDKNIYRWYNKNFNKIVWFELKEDSDDYKKLKTNIRKIIKLLKENNLKQSAKQLKSYLKEKGIII